ncbi:hypothetical protein J3R82DRAFT_2926 [Butyriboletus roseoflavus]|nr:hypothetical protein J3R82DRAFT_2926 [Butyriboletus roseoflavus]
MSLATAATKIAPNISNTTRSIIDIKNPLELFMSRKVTTNSDILQNTLLPDATSTSCNKLIPNSLHLHDVSETQANTDSTQAAHHVNDSDNIVTPEEPGLSGPISETSNSGTVTSTTTEQPPGIPAHKPVNATAVVVAAAVMPLAVSKKAWCPPSNKTRQLVYSVYYHHHTDSGNLPRTLCAHCWLKQVISNRSKQKFNRYYLGLSSQVKAVYI